MKIIFWVLIAIVCYVYAGYPLLLMLLSLVKKTTMIDRLDVFPSVTMLIAAYNEENIIRKKIENTLQIDYPKDKLEVIVVSDGSTDNTSKIVREYEGQGIKLNHIEKRVGKTAAQNISVPNAKGEIIIFSDANGMYRKDAIMKLVRNFRDEKIGCVCGELLYTDSRGNTAGKGENLYWRYERFLKKKESELGSVLGAAGSIYAVRKELYIPIDESLISDFLEPIKIYEKGYGVVYEPEAISFEKTSPTLAAEYKRKTRIITRSIFGFMSIRNLLNPFKFGFFSIQLVSHKLLRWLVPANLLLMLIVNALLLKENIYLIGFILQLLFYFAALIGYVFEKLKLKMKLFHIPLYFCMVNCAALVAWFNFIKGDKKIMWDTARK